MITLSPDNTSQFRGNWNDTLLLTLTLIKLLACAKELNCKKISKSKDMIKTCSKYFLILDLLVKQADNMEIVVSLYCKLTDM